MAETDWTELTGGLAIGTVDRGVTGPSLIPLDQMILFSDSIR